MPYSLTALRLGKNLVGLHRLERHGRTGRGTLRSDLFGRCSSRVRRIVDLDGQDDIAFRGPKSVPSRETSACLGAGHDHLAKHHPGLFLTIWIDFDLDTDPVHGAPYQPVTITRPQQRAHPVRMPPTRPTP